jgi:hypothetical protein
MADWVSLLGNASNPADIATTAMDAYTGGQQKALQLQVLRQQQADHQRQLGETAAYRSRVGDLLRVGDLQGAAAQAAAFGDDNASKQFSVIQKNGYDQGAAGAGAFGEVVRSIAALPYEQRHAALTSAAPTLLAMGYRHDAIASFDPTDENLGAVAGLGYSAHDRASDTTAAYDSSTKRIEATNPKVVGGSLVTLGGQELYRAPDFITAPLGSNVLEVGGTASSGYVGGPISADQTWQRMIGAESGGRQFAANGQPLTSSAGAVGRAQVMPTTAPEAARFAGLPWDENRYRTDAAYNEALGRAYYGNLVQRYGGDAEKAAAAYNAGAGRVDRAVTRGGDNWRSMLPRETQGYISKVVGQQSTTRQTRVVQQGVDLAGQRAAQPKVLNEKDIAAARTKLAQAQRLKSQIMALQNLDPEGSKLSGGADSGRPGVYAGVVGGRVSGSLVGGDSDRYDTLVSNIRNTITAFTRVPGIGAQSDYEARLNAATTPDRTRSAAGRAQAYSELWAIATDMERELRSQATGHFGDQPVRAQAQPTQNGGLRVPRSHVDALRSGRITPQQFDARYGAGAATRAIRR